MQILARGAASLQDQAGEGSLVKRRFSTTTRGKHMHSSVRATSTTRNCRRKLQHLQPGVVAECFNAVFCSSPPDREERCV